MLIAVFVKNRDTTQPPREKSVKRIIGISPPTSAIMGAPIVIQLPKKVHIPIAVEANSVGKVCELPTKQIMVFDEMPNLLTSTKIGIQVLLILRKMSKPPMLDIRKKKIKPFFSPN